MLSRLDGAAVTTSDGSGVTFRKRDREMFWSMLRESVALHAEIAKAWPSARAPLPGGHGRAGEPQGLARAGLRPLPLSRYL